MELGFLGPADRLEEATEVGFFGRREGTGAVVILIIAPPAIFINKVVLDGALHPARHVVVDGAQSDGHADGLIAAVHQALLSLGTLEGEINGADGGCR